MDQKFAAIQAKEKKTVSVGQGKHKRLWTISGPVKTLGVLLEDIEFGPIPFGKGEKVYLRKQWGAVYECTLCVQEAIKTNTFLSEKEASFPNLRAYRKHLKTNHNRSICLLCGVLCARPNGLRLHRRKHCPTFSSGKGWKCIECDQRFERPENLDDHQWNGRKCEVLCTQLGCPEFFSDKKAMAWHLRYVHEPTEPLMQPRFQCISNFCDWHALGGHKRAKVEELVGKDILAKILTASRTSLFLYDSTDKLLGYLTYKIHSSEQCTYVAYIDFFCTV